MMDVRQSGQAHFHILKREEKDLVSGGARRSRHRILWIKAGLLQAVQVGRQRTVLTRGSRTRAAPGVLVAGLRGRRTCLSAIGSPTPEGTEI